MKITDVFMLLGGLALFLYGMKIMGEGLELAAGNKLKSILEKMTSNTFMAMLVGLVTTAIIQSSSATTVMLVGFVNSGMMSLYQAVGVIMGANIGTTVTGQLIAFDIAAVAPVITFIGMIIIMFSKKKQKIYIGQVIIGLGILFMGMNSMSTAMEPLSKMESFQNLMTKFSNPFLGMLAGLVVTCIIQSSSASVGILQALAMQGGIGIGSAIYVVFGQNIGTCITSVIASIGTNKNAKRTAFCHVFFNIIGTILFLILIQFIPFVDWLTALSPGNVSRQIANAHTIFNIVTVIFMLPFAKHLANLSKRVIKKEDELGDKQLYYLNQSNFLDSAIMMNNMQAEVKRMSTLAIENVNHAMDTILNRKDELFGQVQYNEEIIDFLNAEIKRYIIKTSSLQMTEKSSKTLQSFVSLTSNLERIGDHAMNIMEHAKTLEEKKLLLSDQAKKDFIYLQQSIKTMYEKADQISTNKAQQYQEVYLLEEKMDLDIANFRSAYIERMNQGICSLESGILFDEILTDVERIADHIMNIAELKLQ